MNHWKLKGSDIEGAMLDEPLGTKTVPQLRWWLTCHGDKPVSNAKKAALIARYTYAQHYA